MQYEKVHQITSSALKFFEDHLKSPMIWQVFPRNFCEEASSLLLMILQQEGINDFKIMKGTNIEEENHYWLESEEYVIDLTAHQFNGITSPFILIEKSKYPLNKIFSLDIHEIIDFQNWSGLNPYESKIQSIFYVDYYK
ncbi:hypothetical protein QZK27_13840 [Acinetobacter baumannii]|uniref:hypothetical protein n=1 Tax=Acinetobacter baumannii TaxID=470 RepID=UPI00057055F7|nr:hypothetical protein [Acinetobacter baumannii]MDN8184198.1 hypothetical protein [Acinetobacter baumannii]